MAPGINLSALAEEAMTPTELRVVAEKEPA